MSIIQPGSLLEMQTLRPHSRYSESQSAFKKMLREHLTAVLLKLDYILESPGKLYLCSGCHPWK